MLKGYERRLIMIRTKNSAFFESAFFVVKGDACRARGDRVGMVEEARRILKESGEVHKSDRKRWRVPLAFLVGFILGGVVMLFLWLAVGSVAY